MLFLIDSNIAIASEPLGASLEPGACSAIEFLELASRNHHDLRTHPASLRDFARIQDPAKRAARLVLFQRYTSIGGPPSISERQAALLGIPVRGSNDEVDQELLAAIEGDAAEYLVSEDQGLHGRARRLGIGDRVITVADAVVMLKALHPDLPAPPPTVQRLKAHQLNINDTIFDGLKEDYPGFGSWFAKAARSQRDALLIEGCHEHAAIAILKPEPEGAYGIRGPLLKVSTLKVASGYSGQKYGELLLKAIFHQAHVERDRGIYLTAFDKHMQLLELLEDFGFYSLPMRSELGEQICLKLCQAPNCGTSPLDYHVRYGPPALAMEADRVFIVPIRPKWHRVLFPDAEPIRDDALLPATAGLALQPFGNAIRKAYLCNSPSRRLRPGDTLLFYRSDDERAVYVVGVCENVMVSTKAEQIAAVVGRRTVYSMAEIHEMARTREVLVVQFRQDRILSSEPVGIEELVMAGVIQRSPQSITKTRPEGAAWLARRIQV